MSTEITITSTTIDINVTESPITIEAPSGAYPLPTSVYSVFGRTGNVVAAEGDYTLTQLAGVTITSPVSGQALVYNGTSWVNNTETYVGTVTSVAATVPTGLTITGSPITTSGTLAFGLAAGYSIPTTAKQTTWDTAYNDSIVSAAVTGTTTKTLTLNQQDGGTVTANWSDLQPVTSVFGRTGDVVAVNGDYTTTLVTEGTNLYYTQTRFNTAFAAKSTTDLAEGTNLYYTDVRARASLSFVAGSGAYNSTTGVITIPTNNNQITNGAAYITLTGLSASAPLSYNNTTGAFSISQANTTTNGYLSSFDWNTFNNKQIALTFGNLTSSDITVTGGTGAIIGAGSTLTLATVNTNTGTFGSSTAIPVITVNGKGLITALTTTAVSIPSGSLSFIGDVTGTGTTGSDTTLTLATVNTNVGAYGSSTSVPTITVNAKGLVTAASQTAIPTATSSVNGLLTSTDWSTFNGKQNQLNGTGFVKVTGTTVSYDNNTYLTTISGIAAGGELSGTYASPSLVNSAVTGKVLTGVNITGGTIADTDSILTAFGKVQNQINGLIGGSIYKGTWDASTNTPTLTSSVGTAGNYYIVSVAGTTNLNGITDWQVGDWVIYQGTEWEKVDNTDAVVSVNGFTGAVSLTTSNISEGTNLYYTDTRARASISGSTGISYNSTSGVITNSAPDQTVSLTASTGISTTGTYPSFTITNTAPDQTVALTSGTGISATGTYPNFTITNTAPDQTVALTQGGTTTITGTYPNFTISSADQYVGTVTSIGITESVAALSITGSPVTTSGNINIGFAGSASQYVAGDGSLVTFPTIITQAQNLVAEVYNNTGATLTKGTIVYIDGGQGNLPTVTKAIATSDPTSAQTFGFINVDLTNNNNGYVTIIGRLENIDTQAFANGTQLYLSGVTAGTYTSTKPQAPIHLVYVAIVVRSHPTQGVLEVKIQNGVEINEIHDVQITSIANGNILQYSSADSLWHNVAGTTTNIAEGTNLYYTDTRARASLSFVAGSGAYNSTTGVITIPTNNTQITNGSNYITLASLSATSPLSYNNTTGAFTIAQATTSVSGYLSSTDWTTFNNKQSTITNPVTGTGTTNYVSKFTGTSSIGNSLIWDNGTNVGINTASPVTTNLVGSQTIVKSYNSDTPVSTTAQTYYTNQSNLYLFGRNAGLSIITNSTNEEGTIFFGNASTVAYASINTGSGTSSVGGDMYFKVGSNTERMRITSAGNVLINKTTAAGYNLEVNGAAFYDKSDGTYIALGYGGSVKGYIGISSQTQVSGVTNGIGLASANDMTFATGGSASERMRITSGGNVGIGTTNTTYSALNIKSSGTFLYNGIAIYSTNGTESFLGIGNSGTECGLFATYGASGSYLPITFSTSGAERMRITSDGTLLIGGASASGAYNCSLGNATANTYYQVRSANTNSLFGADSRGTWFGNLSSKEIYANGSNLNPGVDNSTTLGSSSYRWSVVYAVNGSIQTSDERQKTDIFTSDLGLDFINKLNPVSYKWKVGGNDVEYSSVEDENGNLTPTSVATPKVGIRTHYGLIAQQVKEVLGNKDFGGFVHDKETDMMSLRYDQFISPLIKAIQELNERLNKAGL